MFKNSENPFFKKDKNEDRQMFTGFKKTFEGNINPLSRNKLFMSPQSKLIQRHPSPFLGKMINKQNQQSTGNHFKNPPGMSPRKLPLTPSKLKNLYQSPRGVLKDNVDGIQFRTKSSTPRLFDFKKTPINQYQTTREQDQGFKLLNLNTKRGSIQCVQTTFQCRVEDDKKYKNDVLDDIIKNCGKKQKQNQTINSTGIQFRPKTPLSKQNTRAKTMSNYISVQKHHQQLEFQCYNNHNKQAKYKLIDTQTLLPCYYCAKCAIILIQQGYNLQQIQSYQFEEHKVLSPDAIQILNQLSSVGSQLQRKHQGLLISKNQCHEQYCAELNTIDQYYDSLIKCIEQLRCRDKQIIQQYQSNTLRPIENLIGNIQNSLNEIYYVKSQIENKPDMIDVMKNTFESHIQMYQQLVHYQQGIVNKNLSIIADYSKIDEFRRVLLKDFCLTIQNIETQIESKMDCSHGMAFSFQGAMLLEQQNNPPRQKPFKKNLFCGEQENQNNQMYQPQQQSAQNKEQGQGQEPINDGSCSPSFKKI